MTSDNARAARFWARVDRSTREACWEWQGAKANGYGRVWWEGRLQPVHRVAFVLAGGEIPDGLQLDHLCRNRACANPGHLEPVTHGVNTLRGISTAAQRARQTKCVNGHFFTTENTYRWRNERHCRTCRDLRNRGRAGKGPTVSTACAVCAEPFSYVRQSGGRTPILCSDACRRARRRAKRQDST